MQRTLIAPQKGPQWEFLASSADIVIYGGAAGGGKSYGLLLVPLRHIRVPGFGCTIFRRNFNQIFSQGGLWDEASSIYSRISGAYPSVSKSEWRFSNGGGVVTSKVTFAHIDRDESLMSWQGSQLCGIGFDELTHFTEKQFFYMLSRNRSTCGVRPFIRGTCNPDADSWVAQFIAWWIDQDTGYPIPERCGAIRWMYRSDDTVYWASKRSELWERFNLKTAEERAMPRSVAFINSTLQDNKLLMQRNPSYLANLKALPTVERERLLYGNWKIKQAAGLFFKRTQVRHMLPVVPDDVTKFVRAWDLAATPETEKGDPAYTAGVLMGKRADGCFIVIDVINVRQSASDVRATIRHTAEADNARYGNIRVRLPQDPGQAGKDQAESFIRLLSGFSVTAVPVSGSKEARAEPVAAQWQASNFDVIVGDWNESYFSQLESFPASKFKDMVDATSDAFAELERRSEFGFSF